MTTEGAAGEKRAVKGSCHCGYITYEADFSKDMTVINKCNCTMCQKPGFISIKLDSSGKEFRLLSPKDESQVKYYQFRNKDCYRFFCDKCGVQVWGYGKYSWDGVEYKFFSANLSTIDQPQDGIDLSHLKFEYYDGLKDNWMAGPQSTPYSGGIA